MNLAEESVWTKQNELPAFPALHKNEQTEVLVVGGGITGIMTAYELTKLDLQVILIDASTLCSGTTGRTTAKITAQHGLLYDSLIKSSGIDQAEQYYTSAIEGRKHIEKVMNELQMNIKMAAKDSVMYTTESENIQKIEDEFQAYEKLDIPGRFNKNIDLPINSKAAITLLNQLQFDPIAYLKHVVEACVQKGVKIFEHTQAIDLEHSDDIEVATEEGHKITSTYVVQATHFPFHDPLGMFTTRLIPERSYIYAGMDPSVQIDGMYLSCDTPERSIRSTTFDDVKGFLIGGEGYTVGKNESIANPYAALKQTALDLFPEHTFSIQWSAQDYNTMDSIPYIGRLKNKNENIFVATGFKKWGMTTSSTAALLIADLIQNRNNVYEKLYSPSRFDITSSVPKFVKQNTHVATQLVKGKITNKAKPIEELQKNEATTIFKGAKKIGVFKDDEGKIHGIDTKCTHLGCEVEWNSYDYTWDCPCHGSRYTHTGKVIEGPAKESLSKENIKNMKPLL